MGDLNNNNAIRPTQGGQAAAAPAERSRPQGRLSAEGSGEGRAVVVQQVPPSPFGTRTPPVPLPRGLDLTKMREFLAKYPTRATFEEAFPELNDVDLPRTGDITGFLLDVLLRGERVGQKSRYEALLVEYGVKELIVAIRELRSRPEGRPAERSTRNMPDLQGDKFAIKAWKDNFDPYNLKSYKEETDVTRAILAIGDSGLARQVAEITRTDESFERELTSRTATFVERLPCSNGFFRVNETRARYFRDLFKAEFAQRFLQELSSKLFVDKPTKSKLDEVAQSIGDELFAEIFLSQMRMEAAAPDFKRNPSFSRIMIQGLKTLHETGDVEKARAAVEREASACWPHLPPRSDRVPQSSSPTEALAYVQLRHAQTLGAGRFGSLGQLQPPAIKPFIEDMVYYFFVANRSAMATPGVVMTDVYDLARSAPFD